MNDETLKFFAKYCFGETSVKDFSDWAIDCLEHGLDSKNLRILASMFNAQYLAEVETYFIKSLDEMNLDYPTDERYLPAYAKLIARQIINKEIDAVEGCDELQKVYIYLDFNSDFSNWNYLHQRMHPETFEDLEGAELRLEEAIIDEASKMIYGKKTMVYQYETKPDFKFAEEKPESLFSKLWKKIF